MTTANFLLLMMINKIKNVNYLWKFKFEKKIFILSSQLPQTPTDFVVFTAFLAHYLYLPLYMWIIFRHSHGNFLANIWHQGLYIFL